MKTKYALVLSGGGFKGAFQVGALQYLSENWKAITGESKPMKFDIISGVSAGALNGALLAMNEFKLLKDLWLHRIAEIGASEIYTSPIIDTKSQSDQLQFRLDKDALRRQLEKHIDLKVGLFDMIGAAFSKSKREQLISEAIEKLTAAIKTGVRKIKSIASNDPLRDKLTAYLKRQKIRGTIFTCGFVSLDTGIYHSVAHNEFASPTDFVNGVLASTAIPIVWKPVEKVTFEQNGSRITSCNNIDGGIVNVSPLGDVIKLIDKDPDDCRYKVIILNCHTGRHRFESYAEKSIGAIALRAMYDLSLTEVFNNDLNHFLRLNDIIGQLGEHCPDMEILDAEGRPMRSFDAVVIGPHPDVDMGNALVANKTLTHRRIAHGYYQAMNAFKP